MVIILPDSHLLIVNFTPRLEQLLEKPIAGSDLDPRVISAYITTCQAEAQEVTIARAIELKHSASLISALANQTSQLFLAAAASVKPLEMKYYGKWLIYLQLKAEVYESYVSAMNVLLNTHLTGALMTGLLLFGREFTGTRKVRRIN